MARHQHPAEVVAWLQHKETRLLANQERAALLAICWDLPPFCEISILQHLNEACTRAVEEERIARANRR